MRSVTFFIIIVFFLILSMVSIAFGAGFGGRAYPTPGIICSSGGAFNVGSRYAFPFWFSSRTPGYAKNVLGLYRSTDSSSCCRPSGENCVPITVYKVDRFGQSK